MRETRNALTVYEVTICIYLWTFEMPQKKQTEMAGLRLFSDYHFIILVKLGCKVV